MRTSKNPWVGVNYLDDNRRMAVPPAFWLQRLFDFDGELVVFPSRYVPYAYVLARRRRVASPMDLALSETITQPDTRFCLSKGLVPVCLIYRHTQAAWSIDNVIASLQARDIWRAGGGEKAADLMDASDQRQEDATKATIKDDMWARSGQAWESYQRRTGQRVTSPGMGAERHVPTPRSSGSTAPQGSVIWTV